MQRGSLKIVKNRAGVKVWRAQWREDGAGRTRYLGTYSELNRAEARAELDKIVAPINAGSSGRRAQAVTLRRFIEDDYLISKNRKWKSSTRATTEQILETHVIEPLGDRQLTSVTRHELQAHLDALAERGLSFSLVAHVRWQLAAIFRMAKSDGLILIDPAGGLDTPRCKAAPEKRVITGEQIVRAQWVLGIRERLIFRLGVCEGMRPGEITGLQFGDVRADGLHIQRRIYRGIVDTPKSWRSRRIIPPTATTKTLLDEYVSLFGERAADAWLFASEAGDTPLSYSNVYRRNIRPALKKIGLENVNFQVMRRSWITELSKVESDPGIRARMAGHSVDTSENVYRQGDAEANDRAMQKIDEVLQ